MPETFLAEAERLIAAGEIGEAIAVLESAIEEGKESAAIAKRLAQLSLRIDEVRAFQNWCHEALRLDPNDVEVYHMLEDYFRRHGREFEADEAREAAEAISRRAGSGGSPPAA
jgi:tetratricopeptide (TPR) repeat protein